MFRKAARCSIGAANPNIDSVANHASRWVDSEEIASAVVQDVIKSCDRMLEENRISRKAFNFAVATSIDTALSHLDTCFVAHDAGDDSSDWALETEPAVVTTDSCARMHVKRAPPRQDVGSESRGWMDKRKIARRCRAHTQASEMSNVKSGSEMSNKMGSVRSPKQRSWPMTIDDIPVDEEEERCRILKAEREKVLAQAEKAKQKILQQEAEDAKKSAAWLEELSNKECAFDSAGSVIFVNRPAVNELPELHDVFAFHIEEDHILPSHVSAFENTCDESRRPVLEQAEHRGTPTSDERELKRHRLRHQESFTDSFSRFSSHQPPLVDTIKCSPGVTLTCGNIKKTGMPSAQQDRCMSRKEYLSMCASGKQDAQTSPVNYPSAKQGSSDLAAVKLASKAAVCVAAAGTLADAPSPVSRNSRVVNTNRAVGGSRAILSDKASSAAFHHSHGSDALRQRPMTAGAGSLSLSISSDGSEGIFSGDVGTHLQAETRNKVVRRVIRRPMTAPASESRDNDKENMKAPPAPVCGKREATRRFEALGNVARAPRERAAVLGTKNTGSIVQPPIGATMGHGLICPGSSKDSFFFPSRSSSDVGNSPSASRGSERRRHQTKRR